MKDAGPPRFVPILTEVVQAKPDPGAEDLQLQLALRVRDRVLAQIEPLVLEALRSVQTQQAAELEARVRADLLARVDLLVQEALSPTVRD
jgi:hypothetical protein